MNSQAWTLKSDLHDDWMYLLPILKVVLFMVVAIVALKVILAIMRFLFVVFLMVRSNRP